MNQPRSLTLRCPAKVNLALSVGTADPNDDRGRHPIASWMVAIDLVDELTLSLSVGDESVFAIEFDPDGPAFSRELAPTSNNLVDWPLESDLAYRAHLILEEHIKRDLDVDLELRKRIPTGAGLGGGSSNAAATLIGLNELFDLGIGRNQLDQMSQVLGSDVAFAMAAIWGSSSAVVTGFGEQIEPMPLAGTIDLVLILPPFGCPTGPVYMTFDQIHGSDQTQQADLSAVQKISQMYPLPPDAPFNDLGEPAQRVQPGLALAQDDVRELLGMPVHVTGSGAAMYVVAPDAESAGEIAGKIVKATNLAAIATRTL